MIKRSDDIIANKSVKADITDSLFDQLQSGTAYSIEVTAVNVNDFGDRFYSGAAKVSVSTSSCKRGLDKSQRVADFRLVFENQR